MVIRKPFRITCCVCLFTLGACVLPSRDTGAYGSLHTHRFQQPPEKAARCFARNAEEHSSALVSEVQVRSDGGADVIVRVKNGVTYATAEIDRAGSGTVRLMVRRSGTGQDLLEELAHGC